MIKKISITVVLASLLLFNTGCDDYLDVNYNVDGPDYVEAYLYLAGIIQAYQGIYWDIRATGPLTQMMGTTSYTTFAANYYSSGSDAGGEMWRMSYWLQGMNLENLINQSVEAEDWTIAGIGYAIKAFSWDQLTKYHGELILTDAYVAGLLSHNYNYQDEVYDSVRVWAYRAIDYLQMEDNHGYGDKITSTDYIYFGETDKWIKFAYGVIVSNLASLSNKDNFTTDYAQELIDCAALSFQSSDDDATVKVEGGAGDATYSAYNNFWGTYRANLSRSYFQHEYAVQVFTGTVPLYDETTGNKTVVTPANAYIPYELAAEQIICDTNVTVTGHYDPRVALKLATTDNSTYLYLDNVDSIKRYHYYGGSFTSTAGPIGSAPSFYGRAASGSTTYDGEGRWLYRDDAPYVLMTCAQIKFCLAEAYWKMNMKTEALQAFKDGVNADLEFTGKYISTGKANNYGGDKITSAAYSALAAEYAAGPFVDGLDVADFTLSHIMMQKWVALYPWGASEAWVDLRKYHYDIDYSGEYPTSGDGWDNTVLDQKWDTDDSKVYKGLYLAPAQVQSRKGSYSTYNQGSPCFRVRPRYNSEYMWNYNSLSTLKPISGTADNYHCSIPWFAYPGDMPTSN